MWTAIPPVSQEPADRDSGSRNRIERDSVLRQIGPMSYTRMRPAPMLGVPVALVDVAPMYRVTIGYVTTLRVGT